MRSGASFGLEDLEVSAARMMRPRCSDCGRSGLMHARVSRLMGAATPTQRQHLAEGLAYLGDEAGPNPVAWLCRECGALGVFSDFRTD